MEMLYFSASRLAYLLKCSQKDLEGHINAYLDKHPLKININHYMMLPHLNHLSTQLRNLNVKVDSCDDIDLLILVLGKTIDGIYIPNNNIDIKNIANSPIVYGFKQEFQNLK